MRPRQVASGPEAEPAVGGRPPQRCQTPSPAPTASPQQGRAAGSTPVQSAWLKRSSWHHASLFASIHYHISHLIAALFIWFVITRSSENSQKSFQQKLFNYQPDSTGLLTVKTEFNDSWFMFDSKCAPQRHAGTKSDAEQSRKLKWGNSNRTKSSLNQNRSPWEEIQRLFSPSGVGGRGRLAVQHSWFSQLRCEATPSGS